jgi:hypothetical protein
MKNTNKDYQARFRKKQADEKNRIDELIKNYDRPDLESNRKLLEKIKRAMKNISVDDDGKCGKFRASDKYKSPNTFVIEGLEYLVIMLKKTNIEDLNAAYELRRQAELQKHKRKMREINSNHPDLLQKSSLF